MNSPKVVIFDIDDSRLSKLAYDFEQHGHQVIAANSYEQMQKAELYILDISFGMQWIEELAKTNSATIAVIADQMNMEDWQKCLQLEIKYFARPVNAETLIKELSDFFIKDIELQDRIQVKKKKEESPLSFINEEQPTNNLTTVKEAPSPNERVQSSPKKKTLSTTNKPKPSYNRQTFRQITAAVYSPKGGVGKTTTALNLAAECARHESVERCVLVDVDKQFGNTLHMLGIPTRVNLSDFSKNITVDSSWREIEENLFEHDSGLYILPSPKSLIEAERITSEDLNNALAALKKHVDVIILDMSPFIDQLSTVAFSNADVTFVITTTDAPTNNSLTDFLSCYEKELRMDKLKLHLVLNRIVKKTGISSKHIEGAFPEIPLVASIKEDPAIQASVNSRTIYTLKNKNSDFTKNLHDMMEILNLFQEDNISLGGSSFLSRVFPSFFKKKDEVSL